MLHNICNANVAVRSKREYLLGSTSTQFFASALRRHQCALYFCSSWPSSTMHDMSSTTTLHLPITELHIEAHCTARLTPSIRAAWDHHSTTFTSALGCAIFFRQVDVPLCSLLRPETAQDWLSLGVQFLGWPLEGRELFLSVCIGTYLSPLGSLLFEAAASLLVMRHCRSSCMQVPPPSPPLKVEYWQLCKKCSSTPCRTSSWRSRAGATQGRGSGATFTCPELLDPRSRDRIPVPSSTSAAASTPAPAFPFFALK